MSSYFKKSRKISPRYKMEKKEKKTATKIILQFFVTLIILKPSICRKTNTDTILQLILYTRGTKKKMLFFKYFIYSIKTLCKIINL